MARAGMRADRTLRPIEINHVFVGQRDYLVLCEPGQFDKTVKLYPYLAGCEIACRYSAVPNLGFVNMPSAYGRFMQPRFGVYALGRS